jgi:hypothetical protein
MANESTLTPAEVGETSPFPPTKAPEGSPTIGSTCTTATGDGTIGSAVSASDNLADVAPNPGE